jgi:uncharacterized membrane protein (UPF0136 family)
MPTKPTSWTVLVYGIFLVILGYLGYNAGSLASLIGGSGFGGLMICSAFLMFYHKKIGVYSALILTLALTATFAYRYTLYGKPIPAIMAVLSGGMLLFLLAQTAKWKQQS